MTRPRYDYINLLDS